MKIYFESYGCTLNRAESGLYFNRMLSESNEPVATPDDADLSIIGTCVVIKHTEDRMLSRIQELSEKSRVRVIGCLPAVSNGALETGRVETAGSSGMRDLYRGMLDDVVIREPSAFEGIPINQGCTGSCHYCISHVARGPLISRQPEKIKNQVEIQLSRGIREVRLSSLDTAAYGRDLGIRLSDLLRTIAAIPEDFRIRVGMMEPKNTNDIKDELFSEMRSSKVFRFLHLPVQSGDDRILDLMNREYHSGTFSGIVRTFRDIFPDSVLSTDIIVGYHDEDEAAHESTVKLMESTKPDIMNITRFSPRPFTPDYNAKVPPSNIVKKRARQLTDIHREILAEKLQRRIGKTANVLITEKGKSGTVVGRDPSYRPIVIPADLPVYSTVEAEIVGSGPTYLVGRPL